MSLDADIAGSLRPPGARRRSFASRAARCVALVGPSGAGKTDDCCGRSRASRRSRRPRSRSTGAVLRGHRRPASTSRRSAGTSASSFRTPSSFRTSRSSTTSAPACVFTGTSRPVARCARPRVARAHRHRRARRGDAVGALRRPGPARGAGARASRASPTCCSSTSRSRRSTSRRGPRSAASSAAISRRSAASGCSSPTTRIDALALADRLVVLEHGRGAIGVVARGDGAAAVALRRRLRRRELAPRPRRAATRSRSRTAAS
mgnify:CR=1 FL=1